MKAIHQPLVSIITLNYNQTEVTCEFLASVKNLSYPNYEVIVVDNDSVVKPSAALRAAYPGVKFILNNQNLGFAGGNNVGIMASKGAYILIINNDTEVREDLIERLLEPFGNDPKVCMVSPKIHYFYQPGVIQYAGYTAINSFTGRNKALGNKEKDEGQCDQSGYTHYGHGAAMMVSRSAINRVGLMPEIFFVYYEELDWSERLKKAGYKIYYQASALVYHKESITVGKESVIKTYYQTRNRILFMRRNTHPAQFAVFITFYMVFAIPKSLIRYLAMSESKHLSSFFRALLWNLKYKLGVVEKSTSIAS